MHGAIDLSFLPDFRNVDLVRIAFSGLLNRALTSPKDAGDLLLAFTEALNNAVEHSGAPGIRVRFQVDRDGVVFQIITAGERFDSSAPVQKPDINELPEGGFGLSLIRELTDEVRYEYVDGHNVLTLIKRSAEKKKESE